MFSKILGLIFSILLTVAYVIGFIYDASYLEVFGVNYYEIMGSPLDYLSIGGMYLLLSYSKNCSAQLNQDTFLKEFCSYSTGDKPPLAV